MPFSAVPTQGVEPRDDVSTEVSAKDERAPPACLGRGRACLDVGSRPRLSPPVVVGPWAPV